MNCLHLAGFEPALAFADGLWVRCHNHSAIDATGDIFLYILYISINKYIKFFIYKKGTSNLFTEI